MIKRRLSSAALLVLLLAACGTAPVRQRADGRPTIVSLNPCSDAILAEFTPPDQLLAISHFSKNPAQSSMPAAQAARYRSTSGRVEEILALAPDLVVADRFLPAPTRHALEQAGIAVFNLDIPQTVDDSLSQVRALADLARRSEDGDALAEAISAAWRQDGAEQQAPVSALMWQENGIVPGPDSLVAALLSHSGFTLHSAARGLGQGQVLPLEQVLADPPELILTAGSARALHHPALEVLADTARAQFDQRLLYCAGPTIPRALARLREIREGFS
ncbi:ABC transporter substrate-binding protein [Aurantiacibacter xanthus]|uniref:ABC transporter substrate-binding protein n=1 Tax=Aurantiacibacter xanthus TaxID=1784712 RepID=UPI001FE5ACE5|nr:helical backbone metal receptor [Aurantiacibacter xanthus]